MSGPIPPEHKSADRFLGTWKAAAQDGFQVEIDNLMIEYDTGNPPAPLTVKLTKSDATTKSFSMDYGINTDTLMDKNENLIGFWRNPSADIIFAIFRDPSNHQNSILTARRTESPRKNPPVVDGKQWTITNSDGHHAPAVNQLVSLRKMQIGREMYGLYWNQGSGIKWDLYDMVYYHAARDSFLSVFGVRILKLLPGGGIFASFDNSYSTPSGFMGGDFMGSGGALNLFGESGDPDAGCWCGEPASQSCP